MPAVYHALTMCIIIIINHSLSSLPPHPSSESTFQDQYVAALYNTITTLSTMGYGDMVPVNTSERIVNIFVLVFGATMFSYVVANISDLVQRYGGCERLQRGLADVCRVSRCAVLRDLPLVHTRHSPTDFRSDTATSVAPIYESMVTKICSISRTTVDAFFSTA